MENELLQVLLPNSNCFYTPKNTYGFPYISWFQNSHEFQVHNDLGIVLISISLLFVLGSNSWNFVEFMDKASYILAIWVVSYIL